MDDLYDHFQIRILSREDITTRFSVANNSIVDGNWKLVLATLTFYSVALAETASTKEGFFTYLHNGEIKQKDLPSACRDFIQSIQDRPIQLIKKWIDESSDEDNYSIDDESDDEDYHPYHQESFDSSHNLIAPLDRYDNGIEKYRIKPTHNPPLTWPVGTYSEKTSESEATGYCHGEVGEINSFVYDFHTCASELAEITEIIGDWNEEPGNWGDCMSPTSIRKQKDSSPTLKTITLNLNRFRVRIEKREIDTYEVRFTPIHEIHHAASMMARKCTIKWSETKLKPISIMNKVVIRIIERTSETITIQTEYMALDCL